MGFSFSIRKKNSVKREKFPSRKKMLRLILAFAFLASVAPFVIRPEENGSMEESNEVVAVSGEDVAEDGDLIAKQNYLHHSGGYHHHHHHGPPHHHYHGHHHGHHHNLGHHHVHGHDE